MEDSLAGESVVFGKVIVRIRAKYRQLSEAERLVAQFIELHPEQAVHLPVKELAARIGVSEATIIRCCRALDYSGLRELKLALAAEIRSPLRLADQNIVSTDTVLTIVQKVLRSDMQVLVDTLATLKEQSFEQAMQALLTARRIECYGIGSSYPIALYAYHQFQHIGLPVAVVMDIHMQAISATQLLHRAVAFAIIHSGQTTEMLQVLQQARAAGAHCILLGRHDDPRLSAYTDTQLLAASRQSLFQPEAATSSIAYFSIIEALAVAVEHAVGVAHP